MRGANPGGRRRQELAYNFCEYTHWVKFQSNCRRLGKTGQGFLSIGEKAAAIKESAAENGHENQTDRLDTSERHY